NDSVTSPSSSIFSSLVLMSLPVLDGGHSRCLGALRALPGLEGHLGSFRQGLEAVPRDRAVMHEQVLATVGRSNEAISLCIVEPLYGSGCHIDTSFHYLTNGSGRRTAQPNDRSKLVTTVAGAPVVGTAGSGRSRRLGCVVQLHRLAEFAGRVHVWERLVRHRHGPRGAQRAPRGARVPLPPPRPRHH